MKLVAQRKRTILQTLPRIASKDAQKTAEQKAAQEKFVQQAQEAVGLYVAWLPPSEDVERRDLPAHRPVDVHRHVMIGDLYDAYMTVRGDELESRGFIRTANAVLTAAGLSISVTKHDLANLREQRGRFAGYL